MQGKTTRLEVLCVGTELLSGKINTHMSFLAPALRGVGLRIARESSVGDTVDEIREAVSAALHRSDVLLITGGLGPTFDDLTREGVAEALGLRLTYHPAIFEGIRRRFLRYGRSVPEENKRQAFVIEGATVLANKSGSAPGQRLTRDGKTVFLLPGPGSEMIPMAKAAVLPFLRKRYSAGLVTAKTVLHLCGVSESAADESLGPLYRSAERRGVEFTILSQPGLVDLHVTATTRSVAESRRRLASAVKTARTRVGRYVFGVDDETLESVVGAKLLKRGWTLALAESCTGGMVAKRITNVPGSSAYLLGGVVTYANEAKVRELGVPRELLERSGAVSEPCARAMAEGVRSRWGADCGVGITGIAGPGGGTKKKPVGLTYLAFALPRGRTRVVRFHLPGDREAVRSRASIAALSLLWRLL